MRISLDKVVQRVGPNLVIADESTGEEVSLNPVELGGVMQSVEVLFEDELHTDTMSLQVLLGAAKASQDDARRRGEIADAVQWEAIEAAVSALRNLAAGRKRRAAE